MSRSSIHVEGGALTRRAETLWSRLSGSPRARSAARGALFMAGVALLALIGSGRMARWLTPPPDLAIGVAHAALAPAIEPLPAPSASATAVAAAAPASPSADPEVGAGSPEAGDAGATSAGVAPDGKIILNLATEEDLRRLPGIGHGRAQAILALRERLKKFTRLEDLLKVKGIGRRGLTRLRPLVRVD